MGEIGSKDVINLLIQDLKNPNSFILKKAIEALGRIRQEAAIPGLLEVLGCSNPKTHITKDVRNRASSALVQIGSEAAIPGLRELLTHPHKHVRIKAKYTLDKIQSKDDSDKQIRKSISETSEKKFLSDVEVSDLIKFSDNSDKKTRRREAKALGNIEAKEAITKLLNFLEDSDRIVRKNAAEALVKIHSETSLVALLNILKIPDFIAANNGDTFYQAYSAISNIQQKVKYYSPVPQQDNSDKLSPQIPTLSPQSVIYDFSGATIGSFAVNVEGHQQTKQINHDSTT